MTDVQANTGEIIQTDTILQRWGAGVEAGFIAVPNTLIRAQRQLGLSSNEIVVILNLLLHWWSRDRLPFPRSTSIAKRSGLGHRTVQRCLSSLEKKGLVLRKHGAEGEARYNLDGLREALAEAAKGNAWNRPQMIRNVPAAKKIRGGEGVQNPNP